MNEPGTQPSGPLAEEIQIRVRYSETDQMGIVYHANYLLYFEQGRTEFLRSHGFDYKGLEQRGFLLVLTNLSCRFHYPACYDDLLVVRTTLQEIRNVTLKFAYHVYRLSDRKLLVEGETKLACVGKDMRPRRLPPDLISSLEQS